MLVLERLGNLELLLGLPHEWLPGEDNRLYIEKTPTKFGRVTIELTSKGKGEYELVFMREKGNQLPVDIVLNWEGAITESNVKPEQTEENRWRLPEDCFGCRMKLVNISFLRQ